MAPDPEGGQGGTSLRLRAVGDIMLGDGHLNIGSGVRSLIRKRGGAFPFERAASLLEEGDALLTGNLEVALTSRTDSQAGNPYIGDLDSAAALKEAGFRLLTLANNHMLEQGKGAAIETEERLASLGVTPVGLPFGRGARADLDWRGVKTGFLAFTFVRTPGSDPFEHRAEEILRAAEKMAVEVDLPVVSLHWGAEFVRLPSPEQIRFGRLLVEKGIRVVLGHHPHTVQPVELWKNGLIAYSLGNFVFDMAWAPGAQEGILLDMNIPVDRAAPPEATVLPLRIDADFRPAPAEERMEIARFNETIRKGLDFDFLAAVGREDYGPVTWEEREKASAGIRAWLRTRPHRVSLASWRHLLMKRLRRAGGGPALTREEVDASWTLE